MIPLLASVVLVYLATVRYLRYRRLHAVQARIRASAKEPSPSEAQSALQGTALLISTFISCPLEHSPTTAESTPCLGPRGNIALARVNWLHRRYNISNDDVLYTLALFILEPMWRPYSPEEANDVGRHMNIKEIPETLGELEEWSRVNLLRL
ncbi:uncharacterized protein BT62DRAFT_1011446 [Guyanagaster necrorhizus]|uniref:ER-bound oxygenase mpaB/mpaB'/Rubber oxygenase catalytic domain-containing protein n=1 Tax=Guyanagaster necrorhizus TaxID=856835 RepID=A0A9P7VJF8_9AGAR|nr:uncharacterized protein BT62DRAFT_1011446 [Guyanagaster necrorhizus MCA 3950]KAG7441640.1 hypothetical protein BT62DRAFT_1011446 [Guyanagaster necrorhizus MCA 3950]